MIAFYTVRSRGTITVWAGPHGNICGIISKEGFFFDSNILSESLLIVPEELRAIADKVEETKQHGIPLPVCEKCAGEPYSPNEVPATEVFEKHICTHVLHKRK